jgi:hypothetical protein
MIINRSWAMPSKNTFDILPIKNFILKNIDNGKWLDPFANKNKIATITNDIDPQYDTNFHLDAINFLSQFENESIDGILFDPPYSPRQVSECYKSLNLTVDTKTTQSSYWGNLKKEISRITKPSGKVITFSWNSGGIGNKYGFNIEEILLVAHGGWHNDTICVLELKNQSLFLENNE